ncbi:WXG100 family type VII secretion target [Janibacter anophelis]|uniref:WXG100 family type VII secretion target n=1 Tax=Janibacter anophelis TaxID=319054 RepID=UPI0013B061F7|nr:WXG100 family type VII secretion target [Janibacter anophelis]
MSVEQGLDPQQITAVADQLAAQGDRLEQVHHSGTAMMGVLAHSWAGPDVEFFTVSWDQARSHIESMSTSLREASKALHRQAQEQIRASGESATGGVGGSTNTGGRSSNPRDARPWDDVTDFGKGLLLPSTGVIDTAKKIADHTADGIREGADRVNDGIQEGVDRVNEGMDWLEDRADQARDWGEDKADELADAAPEAAARLLLAATPGFLDPAALEVAEAAGLINQHGEAGETTDLSTNADTWDDAGNVHPRVTQPTSLEAIMRNTSAAYENDGTVRITEITRPDGTSAYIVNIPGTQFGSDLQSNPLDAAGNVPTVGGNSSAATEAVWDAMDKAGIPPGAPVLTVGHSQGGMIAQTLLSDPAFTERFNVTHSMTYGSPVDAIPDTSDARQLHLRHESDMVPRLDLGNGPLPSRLQDDSTVVPLHNPPGVQPFAPSTPTNPVPLIDIVDAHSERKYADSVGSSSDPRVTAFEDDLGDFIVPTGEDSKVSAVDIEIRRKN